MTDDTWSETRQALGRLRRSLRIYVTLVALDWAARSLGKLGLTELQITIMRVIVATK